VRSRAAADVRAGSRGGPQALGQIDTVVVTAGEFGTQAALEADLERTQKLLNANFTGTVLFCEHARACCCRAADAVRAQLGRRRARPETRSFFMAPPKRAFRTISKASITSTCAAGLKVVCVKPGS
jgi:NADP-dependent 3-hydroxy acid dehydrogenase YdfG